LCKRTAAHLPGKFPWKPEQRCSGNGGPQFREAFESVILPRLRAFAPDIIVISAGFDAHMRDPLASLNLLEPDFAWVTEKPTSRSCSKVARLRLTRSPAGSGSDGGSGLDTLRGGRGRNRVAQ